MPTSSRGSKSRRNDSVFLSPPSDDGRGRDHDEDRREHHPRKFRRGDTIETDQSLHHFEYAKETYTEESLVESFLESFSTDDSFATPVAPTPRAQCSASSAAAAAAATGLEASIPLAASRTRSTQRRRNGRGGFAVRSRSSRAREPIAEEEEDPRYASVDSDAPVPTSVIASPSNATLMNYAPEADIDQPYQPHAFGRVKRSTKVDLDDAINHYNNMAQLLGTSGSNVPIITCNPTNDTRSTIEPLDLGELRDALEKEPKIGVLYDVIMREVARAGGHDETAGRDADDAEREGEGGARDAAPFVDSIPWWEGAASICSQSTESRLRSQGRVECLLDAYAGIAAGSSLPSAPGGSMTAGAAGGMAADADEDEADASAGTDNKGGGRAERVDEEGENAKGADEEGDNAEGARGQQPGMSRPASRQKRSSIFKKLFSKKKKGQLKKKEIAASKSMETEKTVSVSTGDRCVKGGTAFGSGGQSRAGTSKSKEEETV